MLSQQYAASFHSFFLNFDEVYYLTGSDNLVPFF